MFVVPAPAAHGKPRAGLNRRQNQVGCRPVLMAEGQIVAMGGGGFSMEPENPLLDDFVVSLAKRQPARVCFLPTASGDSAAYVARFYRALSGRCLPSDITLVDSALPRRPTRSSGLAALVAEQDVFYVGGGNTAHLLALWRAHGLDRLLGDAWLGGAVLCGVSAGMNCWFEGSITDAFGGLEPLRDGLGLLEGSACPHFDESDRRPAFHAAIAGGFAAGYAADDGAALHFVGKKLVGAVSSRRNALAYRVTRRESVVTEEPLPTRFLGGAATPGIPFAGDASGTGA
jgi:dipeptidase E